MLRRCNNDLGGNGCAASRAVGNTGSAGRDDDFASTQDGLLRDNSRGRLHAGRDQTSGAAGAAHGASHRAGTGSVVDCFDALPASTLISVLILHRWIGIDNLHTLNIGGVVLFRRQLCGSTSPSHRVGGLSAGITTIPKAKTDFHGGLRKFVACLSSGESAHNLSINGPDQRIRRPVNSIGMESSLWRIDANVLGNTVIQDAFAKVVCLRLNSVGTSEFPIDLVQIIGEQDHAANYSFTWSNLGDVFDTSEKEEEIRIDSGCITLFTKIEYGTHGRVESSVLVESTGPVAGKGLLLSEIHKVGAGRETQSIWASNYEKH